MGSRTFTSLMLTCRTSKMKIVILLVCSALVVTTKSYPVKEDTTTTEPEISTVYDFCKAICDAGGCGAPLCDCGCPPSHNLFGINFHNNDNYYNYYYNNNYNHNYYNNHNYNDHNYNNHN